MQARTGYLYHIKDEFFDKVKDNGLMANHENGHARPTYFTIKDGEILWFIPLSSKVSKYEPIIEKKIKKYGDCKSIMIRKIAGYNSVILIQNAFPTLEKYVDHAHTYNRKPFKVAGSIQREIISNFNSLIALKNQGTNLFFTDIDRIKEIMLEEINSKSVLV